jgi:hypothetical protein
LTLLAWQEHYFRKRPSWRIDVDFISNVGPPAAENNKKAREQQVSPLT